MRWTKNDTLAYQSVTDMGDRIRKMLEERDAGLAFEEGSTQSRSQTGGDPSKYMEGIDDAGQLGYVGGDDPVKVRYGLGKSPTNWQDKEFSPTDLRRSGLQAQGDYFMKKGKYRDANALYDQVDQMNVRQRQLSAMDRADAEAGRQEDFRKKYEGYLGKLQSDNPEDVYGALNELSQFHNASGWGGESKSQIVKNPATGAPEILYYPGGDAAGAPQLYPFTREIAGKLLNSWAEANGRAASYTGLMRGIEHDATRADKAEERADKRKWQSDMIQRYDDDRMSRESENEKNRKSQERIAGLYAGARSAGGAGNPLSKAKAARMQEMDTVEGSFYDALHNGDFATARQAAQRLGNSFDNRGVMKMKRTNANGDQEEVMVNKFELLIDQAASRAGMAQARELKAGLVAEYPWAKIDDVGVDVETNERIVVSGGKQIPLEDFIAAMDKKKKSGLRSGGGGMAPEGSVYGNWSLNPLRLHPDNYNAR